MKILAMEKEVPGVNENDCLPYLKEEAASVWTLYQSGVVREIHFRDDVHRAVLVLECANAGTARDTLNSLPLVRRGLIDFEIISLTPYPGFARLFADQRMPKCH
jgi:hypothetical protein